MTTLRSQTQSGFEDLWGLIAASLLLPLQVIALGVNHRKNSRKESKKEVNKVKKLTEKEKEELKTKIEAERVRTHQEQLKRARSKNRDALFTNVTKRFIGSSGLAGAVAVSDMEKIQFWKRKQSREAKRSPTSFTFKPAKLAEKEKLKAKIKQNQQRKQQIAFSRKFPQREETLGEKLQRVLFAVGAILPCLGVIGLFVCFTTRWNYRFTPQLSPDHSFFIKTSWMLIGMGVLMIVLSRILSFKAGKTHRKN